MKLLLSNTDYRFMMILWEKQPIASGTLAKLCQEQFGWKKSTTYTVIKRLIDNSFSTQYGVNVNLSLVTVDIRTAVLAGTAPDVSLFLASDMPVNLALRGAVEDLSKYEGFEEVTSRFSEGTMTPFAYQDGYYALPLSETFNMMFVRTDIFFFF